MPPMLAIQPLVADDLEPWEQQPGEPPHAYHAFCHFRDLGLNRSIDKSWREHQVQCRGRQLVGKPRAHHGWWKRSVRWGWVARAQALDRAHDQAALSRLVRNQVEARERHARLAMAALGALSVPARAAIASLQDPAALDKMIADAKLSPEKLLKLVTTVSLAARGIPGLVNVERLSLGLSTENVAIEENHGDAVFAARVAESPRATDLAIALLDEIAGDRPAESAAVGVRVLGESGEVAASEAPEPPDPETAGS